MIRKMIFLYISYPNIAEDFNLSGSGLNNEHPGNLGFSPIKHYSYGK